MRLVVVTGQGGVGKTTTAAATALHAAGRGLKTLVLSADPAPSLADVLGVRLGPEPVEAGPGLWAAQPGAGAVPPAAWVLDVLAGLGLDPVATEDLPGLTGLLTLRAVAEQARGGPWDLLVLDCAASAEAFRLLSAPESLGGLLGRLLPMERRISRLTSTDALADPLVPGVDRLGEELAAVRSVLADPQTSVRLVLTPETTVLAGTRRLFTALTMAGFVVDGVVANRVFPAPSIEDAWQAGWVRQQEKVLAEVGSAFGTLPVLRAVYAASEPQGLAALTHFGRALYGDVLLEPEMTSPPIGIDRTETGFTLTLRLPLARRESLDLGRRGDELVVRVDGYRHVVPLPSVLLRCEVQGASLREGTLAVAFVPDPAEFPARWL